MELLLCTVAGLCCSQVRNIAPHSHEEILRFSEHGKFFGCSRGNSGFKHGSVIIYNIFAYFTLSLNTSQGIHDEGKMLVLPNRLLYFVLSTSDQCFVSFQPILCHPHTQIRITLFDGVRISIPNWKPSRNCISIGFSQIAFPITVLPKDDCADFAQEERLGLPYWTMI